MPPKRRMDPSQHSLRKNTGKVSRFDLCQTPPNALAPLLPYLPKRGVFWECACGEGILANSLTHSGRQVLATDLLTNTNFLSLDQPLGDCIVTNPPYSHKMAFLAHCYRLGVPFALLLPVSTLGTRGAQRLFQQHGVEIILLNKRIDFKMPNAGWAGKGAQFEVAWFTWGLGIGRELTFLAPVPPWKPNQEVLPLEDAA